MTIHYSYANMIDVMKQQTIIHQYKQNRQAEFNYYLLYVSKNERNLIRFDSWLKWRDTQAVKSFH